MRTIIFYDTKKFYDELRRALDNNEEVEISTSYRRFSDFLQKLKDIFELEKHKNGKWINALTGAATPTFGMLVPVGLNYYYLYVLASATIGAGSGLLIGGPLGAATGAGIGAVIGIGAAAIAGGKHSVNVEVNASGIIKFVVTPK
jgi:hypothetical protein